MKRHRATRTVDAPAAIRQGIAIDPRILGTPAILLGVSLWTGVPSTAATRPDFVNGLYPRLESHNCRACHNASGVASETRLHFPEAGAPSELIERFGATLSALVDRGEPAESLLLTKPTNRIAHTGGPLIAIGSDDEHLLRNWVDHLVSLPITNTRDEGGVERRAYEPIRRLTHAQYDNSVRDLLGDRTRPSRNFPPEDYVNGYTNQALSQAITPALAEAYSQAAENLARTAFRYGDESGLIPCEPSEPADRSCALAFVQEFGMRAYRRPLEAPETESLTKLLVNWAAREQSFEAGASMVIEAVLQSPAFLFMAPRGAESPLKQFEIISRLAFALWDTLPDDELFDLASRGELNSEVAINRLARRMLTRSAARDAFDRFFAQWMRFDRLLDSVKDRNRYRNFSSEVAESMAEESRRLFRHLVWNDIDFREFFTADYTFLDDFLTEIYNLPDPVAPFGMTRYPDDSLRGGILGHGTFLAQTGKPINTSPTERGLFVREHFLCQSIPPPPPGVDASLPPLSLGGTPMTARQTMTTLHAAEESCASCHKLVDPIGFGFEHFNTVGAYRQSEPVRVEPTPQQERQGLKAETYELPIDSTGYIAGIADSTFRSPREAGRVLAGSVACQKCVVKQLFRYLYGRHETKEDADSLDRAYNRFRESGYLFRELILALVVSEEFLRVEWGS